MFEKFLSNILADKTCSENLKHHIEAAYAVTLKQYHSWIIQKSFAVCESIRLPSGRRVFACEQAVCIDFIFVVQ